MQYVSLSTVPEHFESTPVPMRWGAESPGERGPVVATVKHHGQRNAIGAHGGSYCVYTALAVAAGELDPNHIPQLDATVPTNNFGPFPTWRDPMKLVTIDPWGHMVKEVFDPYFKKGYDIRPTIAVTKAHIDFPEVKDALREGRLKADGHVLKVCRGKRFASPSLRGAFIPFPKQQEDGQSLVTKAAVDPVWYLPGVAARFGCSEVTCVVTSRLEAALSVCPSNPYIVSTRRRHCGRHYSRRRT